MTTFVRIGLGLVGAAALTAATTPAMAGGCASQRQTVAESATPATQTTTTKSAKDATPAAPKPATAN